MNDLSTTADFAAVQPAELGGLIRANYEMTREEAVLVNGLMDRAESDYRFYLLKMREEKGWKALGYASFEDYGEKARGLSAPRLYQIAKAGEIQLSLGDSTNCIKHIPEGQLRPLAPLSDDERRQVWEEAQRMAEEEGRKLTARAVQEAVDRLAAEKAALQGQLDLASQRSEDWRQQSIGTKKALTEAEQKLQLAQTEAATLRRTLAAEAEKLAQAKILEARTEIAAAKDQAASLKDTIKSLKREREDAIQRGVSNKLREQQGELDSKEAQLVSLEQRIAFLKNELEPLTAANRAIAHHRPRIAESERLINAIAVQISDAFDPDQAEAPPDDIRREWERGAKKIDQLAAMIRLALDGRLSDE